MKEWKYVEHKDVLGMIERHQVRIASDIISDGFPSIKQNLYEFYKEVAMAIMDAQKKDN